MLDPYVRKLIDPSLNAIGRALAAKNQTANTMTGIGFFCGILAMAFISCKWYGTGAVMIGLNRLFDGLDGAIARHKGLTDFGGFLDIVFDFIVYAGIVLAFGCADPQHLLASTFLIFSFIGPMVSFLAYAIIAAKRDLQSVKRGKKSFYYLGGLCEGTETAFFLILFCLFPHYFVALSLTFVLLCWITTIGRIYNAWTDFDKSPKLKIDAS
ncbi:MAG: CDP-alcohol phosphatidyltransferase family protein [Alphaproteobacteria bacterium]|nr:CDP-alcohol phosphatidyltransferase family protein [Alphaproteobacteria bacterium]